MHHRFLCAFKPLKKSDFSITKGDLNVRLAQREDLEAIYRLRYDCFYKEYLNLADELLGYDINRFDLFANYLVVTDQGRVVATYRVLEGKRPWDFSFSESFRVRNFKAFKKPILELSRACVAKSHRNRPLPILLLWRALAAYAKERGIQTIIGRASMPGDDPSQVRALYQHLDSIGAINHDVEALPHVPLDPKGPVGEFHQDLVPPLVAGYLRLGAKVAGQSCFDSVLKCFDIFMCLDMTDLSKKF